jgi:hypothetical protein
MAEICTELLAGKSSGAVYRPCAVIVPVCAVPPAIPFTPQETLVSVALVTVALKVMVAPNKTVPELGETET